MPHLLPTSSDTTVLNFALTLEHLENAFYLAGLAQFDQAAFDKANLPPFARGRFAQVAEHEMTHVAFLSAALGDQATQPCNYSLYVASTFTKWPFQLNPVQPLYRPSFLCCFEPGPRG